MWPARLGGSLGRAVSQCAVLWTAGRRGCVADGMTHALGSCRGTLHFFSFMFSCLSGNRQEHLNIRTNVKKPNKS